MNFMIQKLFIIPEYPDYMIYPNGDVFSIRNNKILKVPPGRSCRRNYNKTNSVRSHKRTHEDMIQRSTQCKICLT